MTPHVEQISPEIEAGRGWNAQKLPYRAGWLHRTSVATFAKTRCRRRQIHPRESSWKVAMSTIAFPRPNGTVAKLRAALQANCDAARQLPRLTNALEEVICNCRDAVAQR
jgi:hypothetical protein